MWWWLRGRNTPSAGIQQCRYDIQYTNRNLRKLKSPFKQCLLNSGPGSPLGMYISINYFTGKCLNTYLVKRDLMTVILPPKWQKPACWIVFHEIEVKVSFKIMPMLYKYFWNEHECVVMWMHREIWDYGKVIAFAGH